ncbi:Mor transcription activator family protein [Necropsobacter massiliensis]|uniref:Mor transcription activator family protein n=1 Tax=Necropsobacter massiliensis TaxID=1400001 RepID=UPI0005958D40|nr:Mor transcription activator family protein [Necropsobacter massiliensis]
MKTPRRERIWNDFIEGLDGAILTALSENLDNEQLRVRIIELMQEAFGGLLVYIPKGFTSKVNARNSLIRKEFTGDNHYELSRKYGVSVQWIYMILEEKNESN